MMKRTTLREIKQSFGRYFAILAIVALGVGLFSGLKVTRNVMVASADHYLKKEQLYDFRLLSTLGFEEVDVEVLAGKEDVRAVSGAYSADILYRDSSDNERVIKVHSLTEGVNGVVLTAGRMPAQADECVVDSNLFSEDMIGRRLFCPKTMRRMIFPALLSGNTRSPESHSPPFTCSLREEILLWEAAGSAALCICCRKAFRWMSTRKST